MADSFLLELNEQVNLFVEERDWDVFQTPKNLSMALIVEAAELVEHFQWMGSEESDSLTDDKKKKVAEELADILIYTVCLSELKILSSMAGRGMDEPGAILGRNVIAR